MGLLFYNLICNSGRKWYICSMKFIHKRTGRKISSYEYSDLMEWDKIDYVPCQDNSFNDSLVIGAVTGSGIIGGLVGGDFAGGAVGDLLGEIF